MLENAALLAGWNLAVSTLLAILVFGLGWTRYGERRPALLHCLWIFVLLKMITPPLIPLPAYDLSAAGEPALHAASRRDTQPTAAAPTSTVAGSIAPAALGSVELDAAVDVAADESALEAISLPTAAQLLVAFSIAGSLYLVGRYLVLFRRFSRLLKLSGESDSRIRRVVDACAAKIGVSGIRVRVVDALLPPMIWIGRRESVILFPQQLANQLDDQQLQHIVSHELAHYVRNDRWANSLAMLVTTLCWWNPIAWVARREMSKAQELCCDELAIQQCGGERQAYLATLFQSLEFVQQQWCVAAGLASSFGAGEQVKLRFKTLAAGKLQYRNSWASAGTLALIVVASLCFPVSGQRQVDRETRGAAGLDGGAELGPAVPAQAVVSRDESADGESLYLHWFKPTYFGAKSPPEPLMTIKVNLAEPFDVAFTDSRAAKPRHWIKGQIRKRKGQYFGRVESLWKSPEEFGTQLVLDQPLDAAGFLWVDKYAPTRIVLTKQDKPDTFLKTEKNSEDPFRAHRTPATVAAIQPSNYANELATSVGNSVGNWLSFQVYEQSNPKEASLRNRRRSIEAVAKMLANDSRRIYWNPNLRAEKNQHVAVGQPLKSRFVLDLGDGNKWDEEVTLKFSLRGPPKLHNFAYRDSLAPAVSFLHLDFSLSHPAGRKRGEFSGGAMVRSAFYSRGILRSPGTWPQQFELIKSEEINFSFESAADSDSPR